MKKSIFSASPEGEQIRGNWFRENAELLYYECKRQSADLVFVCPKDSKGMIAAVLFLEFDVFKKVISDFPIVSLNESLSFIHSNIMMENSMVVICQENMKFSFYNLIEE